MPSRNMATARRSIKGPKKVKDDSVLPKKIQLSPSQKKTHRHRVSRHSVEEEYSGTGTESEGEDEPDRCTSTLTGDSFLLNEEDQIKKRNCTIGYRPKSNSDQAENGSSRERTHDGPTPAILIIAALMSIFAVLFVMYFMFDVNKKIPSPKPLSKIAKEIQVHLRMLHQEFGQTKHFWTQILSQLELLTEASPLQPAVLLALVPLDSQLTVVCLSQQLLSIVSNAFEDSKWLSLDVSSHLHLRGPSLKHELDSILKGLAQSHALAIFNLEKVDPDAVMIFHAYCDNENAPHKRALILLTVDIPMHYSSVSLDNLENTVHNLLVDLWTQKMREEDAVAVISRISNAPVLVKPESKDVIGRMCPF